MLDLSSKFCIILLVTLFFIQSNESTPASRSGSLKIGDFDDHECEDGSKYANSLTQFLLHRTPRQEDQLWFFFPTEIVKLTIPKLSFNLGRSIDGNALMYINMDRIKRTDIFGTSGFDFLTSSKNNKVFIEQLLTNKTIDKVELKTYFGYNGKILQFSVDGGFIRESQGNSENFFNRLMNIKSKNGFDFLLVWTDANKRFSMTYKDKILTFELVNEDGVSTIKYSFYLLYHVKKAVYNDLGSKPGHWAALIIEIDARNKIHLNYYSFTYYEAKKFKVDRQIHVEMSLNEFFNCRLPAKWEKRQFKGIYYDLMSHKTFIFIDDYYFQGQPNMINLNLRIETPEYSAKIGKHLPMLRSDHFVEKIGFKYLKQLGDDYYLTFNQFRTFRFSLNRTIRPPWDQNPYAGIEFNETSQETELLVHQCPKQTLEIEGKIFCVHEKFYYFVSDDGYRTSKSESSSTKRFNFINKFIAEKLLYSTWDENVYFIFKSRLPEELDLSQPIYLTFVTDNFIMRIKHKFFKAIPNKDRTDYQIGINIQDEDFFVHLTVNCLFISADDCNTVLPINKDAIVTKEIIYTDEPLPPPSRSNEQPEFSQKWGGDEIEITDENNLNKRTRFPEQDYPWNPDESFFTNRRDRYPNQIHPDWTDRIPPFNDPYSDPDADPDIDRGFFPENKQIEMNTVKKVKKLDSKAVDGLFKSHQKAIIASLGILMCTFLVIVILLVVKSVNSRPSSNVIKQTNQNENLKKDDDQINLEQIKSPNQSTLNLEQKKSETISKSTIQSITNDETVDLTNRVQIDTNLNNLNSEEQPFKKKDKNYDY